MFDSDRWNEIWNTISRNKLRSALTMFGVSWGIFMLMVMLGMGKALENGVQKGFDGWATNSMFLWTQSTSMPYAGFKRGRRFNFNNSDIEAIKANIPKADIVAPRLQLGGWQGANNVSYEGRTGAFNIYGDVPEIRQIEAVDMPHGRFINSKDNHESRKVCVVGPEVVKVLFEGDDPVGRFIKIQGVYFQVIGEYKPKASGDMGENKDSNIHIPFHTFQKAFNSMDEVHWFSITGKPGVEVSEIDKEAKALMAKRHKVDPDDVLAFGSWNMQETFGMMNMLFVAIAFISWLVGTLTLVAGVIGISNIMLVNVKERTKEIGIRRSIGASPSNIRTQIILEAVTLTFFAGVLGMMAGALVLEGVVLLEIESDFFSPPGANITVAAVALVILIVCGLFAGLVPAQRALQIKAVDALRTDK
ncbi:MAG: ABC transporter permease [Flavobacteriales bacterium]